MLWLCLHFPLLPLQVFTRRAADGAARPTLVSERSRVLCVNPIARQSGIKPGQSTATASALCPGLVILKRHIRKEALALQQLGAWCYQFSPMVSLKPPHCVLLEVKGCLLLFKGLTPLQERISSGLSELGFSCQQGWGDTPKAAELFARSHFGEAITPAQTADYQKQLAQVALVYLDVPAPQIRLLQEMGLARLGELLALPRHALGKRFGIEFLHYLEKITGERPDPQLPISLNPEFRSELFYIEGIEDKQGLAFPMKRLLTELCQFLRTRQLYCQSFVWRLSELNQPPQQIPLRLSQAQNNLSAFLELSRIRLEALPLGAVVHSLVLTAKTFVNANPAARDLFDLRHHQGQDSPQLLLDKLSARLGKHALYGIDLCSEHAPELAWQARNINQLKPSQLKPSASTDPPVEGVRPFWLLAQPAPIQQRQQGLFWRGYLRLLRGPERIDSRWWRTPHIQRDYFIAQHEQGGVYWIFRDLVSRRWFVHGVFC